MKIIVGAGNTQQVGWTALQRSDLDIRSRDNWKRLFKPNSLDAVLGEHILEHLSFLDGTKAAANVFEFLKQGGYWRIAVPDANNPNPNYKDWNSPFGSGQKLMKLFVYQSTEPTHQVFYNFSILSALLESVGFKGKPLEYYDTNGVFLRRNWKQTDGKIYRSFKSDYLNQLRIFFNFDNTSLIVDAFKL